MKKMVIDKIINLTHISIGHQVLMQTNVNYFQREL